MGKVARDIATLALCGLVIGIMFGIIAAGAYATWAVGGDMANIGFGTIFAFAPWEVGFFGEPFRTALIVGGCVAAIFTIAAPALGFRRVLTSYGTASWATPAEVKRQGMSVHFKNGLVGPILGKLGRPRSRAAFLTSQNDPNSRNAIPHCLVQGPAGAGKGVGIIIPTLLTYWGSVIVLDPKGENFEKTARRRKAMGDEIYKFNPYAADGRTHRYNPLEYVAEAAPHERLKEAKRVAASLITIGGNGQNFLGGARDLFAATALVMVHRNTPTIAAIYDALTQEGDAFKGLARLAKEADEAGIEEAASLLRRYAGYESKILSSYFSVLFEGGLSLWADPTVRAATSATDFRVERMRQRGTSVYITVSPNDLEPLAPLVRVLFQQSIGVLQQREPVKRGKPGMWGWLRGRRKPKPDELNEPYPVLFVMDEFVSLGKLEVLIRAMTTLRGYGGRVMIIIQSIASVRQIYGRDGADELQGLCGIQVFMSPSDKDTPEYISASVGKFTRKSRSKQWTSNELKSRYSEKEEGIELIRPEQVRMIGNERIIALIENSNPVLTHRATYYEDRVLKRLYEEQAGDLPLPDVPPRLGPAPALVPLFDMDGHDSANGAAVDPTESDATGLDGEAAEPIEAPASIAHQASPPAVKMDLDDDAPSASDHATIGEGVEAADEPLPPEKERRFHKRLSHVTIEQSHLHDELLAHLAAARQSSGSEGLTSRNVESKRPSRDAKKTPEPTPARKGLSAGAVDLSALKAARAKITGSATPKTGTDD